MEKEGAINVLERRYIMASCKTKKATGKSKKSATKCSTKKGGCKK